MLEQKLKEVWKELKEIWNNSSRTEKINFQMSGLINDLKGKISQFEKDSITKDITKIKTSIKKIINKLRTNK
jgi:hypothetical protein